MLLDFIVIVLSLLPFSFFYLSLHATLAWEHWLDIKIRIMSLQMPALISVAL